MIMLLVGCGTQDRSDEIVLKIKLDLREDIGLLIVDYDLEGHKSSGGISNADKTMLKHDEELDWSFDRKLYEIEAGDAGLTVGFRIVTKYFEPNYENIYPEEYVVAADPVTLNAEFGKVYEIKITGDAENGYKVNLENIK